MSENPPVTETDNINIQPCFLCCDKPSHGQETARLNNTETTGFIFLFLSGKEFKKSGIVRMFFVACVNVYDRERGSVTLFSEKVFTRERNSRMERVINDDIINSHMGF